MSINSDSEPVSGPPVVVNRPNRGPGLAIAGIVIVVLIGLGVFQYNRTRPTPATVAKRDIVDFAVLPGEVVAPPYAIADAHAAYAAVVNRVFTSVGSNVRKGDVLVELARPSNSESYAQAKDNVTAAETAYANAKAEYDGAVKLARDQVAAAHDAAQSSAAQSVAATTTTTTTGADGSTSTSVTSAPIMDLTDAQQSLDQARADRDAGLASYQQQLDDARTAYDGVRAGRRMTRIIAPITGTVVALNAQPGQAAGATAAPVATVVKLDELQIQAPLTADQAGLVRPDMKAALTVQGINGRQFDAKVRRIVSQPVLGTNAAVIGTKYLALLSFSNDGGLVRPQTPAQANINVGEVKDALAVPVHAIHIDSTGRPTVKVLDNGQWQTVAVQTGLTDGKFTQIRSGLQEGQTVQVQHGAFKLTSAR